MSFSLSIDQLTQHQLALRLENALPPSSFSLQSISQFPSTNIPFDATDANDFINFQFSQDNQSSFLRVFASPNVDGRERSHAICL
jgi:hypothetical protein